jgi:hypothetical protein
MPRKRKSEIIARIILNLFRDTDIVFDEDFVGRVYDSLGIDIHKVASVNTYKQLKKVEEAVLNVGSEYKNYALVMDSEGKLYGLERIIGFYKPNERIKIKEQNS